jgi:hypothetical protein
MRALISPVRIASNTQASTSDEGMERAEEMSVYDKERVGAVEQIWASERRRSLRRMISGVNWGTPDC